jgi:UDP-4-amino-4,6-dideoxy-L-N-acetyl-beta-L-altrosamine transaminase
MEAQKFIPYAHQTIDEEDIRAVAEVLSNFMITRGPSVEAFEAEIAHKVGAKYAVAFSNGSVALAACFQAAKAGPFDVVVSTPNTFIASVAHAIAAGAHLRLVDIDPYGNMDITLLASQLSIPHTRGKTIIVPVHFGGVAIDMAQLNESITKSDVVIIEDAAHALGSKYSDGKPVGCCANSDMTIFSFHPAKNITCGEGGMVTTNDEQHYNRLKIIRNNGMEKDAVSFGPKEPWYYEVQELSSNYHMTEMQAALGLSQLRHLDQWGEKKRSLIASYRKKLGSVPGVTVSPADADARTNFHLFVIKLSFEALGLTRTQVMEGLAAQGIGSQYHYVPLYNHPSLRKHLQQNPQQFPAMHAHFEQALSLPLFASMEEKDVDRVVMALRKVLFQ